MDQDIEESARFYREDNAELHIRSDFLIADDEEPRAVRVAFILNLENDELKSTGILFSIHDEDVPVFRLLRMRARRKAFTTTSKKSVPRCSRAIWQMRWQAKYWVRLHVTRT
jgi:Mg2+ and Co2+ transporter CorA